MLHHMMMREAMASVRLSKKDEADMDSFDGGCPSAEDAHTYADKGECCPCCNELTRLREENERLKKERDDITTELLTQINDLGQSLRQAHEALRAVDEYLSDPGAAMVSKGNIQRMKDVWGQVRKALAMDSDQREEPEAYSMEE